MGSKARYNLTHQTPTIIKGKKRKGKAGGGVGIRYFRRAPPEVRSSMANSVHVRTYSLVVNPIIPMISSTVVHCEACDRDNNRSPVTIPVAIPLSA